jgi:hypothetical protein
MPSSSETAVDCGLFYQIAVHMEETAVITKKSRLAAVLVTELPTGQFFSAWPGLQAKPGRPMFLIFQIYKN